MYRIVADKNAELVACRPSYDEVLEKARPGDVMWTKKSKSGPLTLENTGCEAWKDLQHIVIYAGDGYIIDSTTYKPPIPGFDYSEFFKVYNTKSPGKYGGIVRRKMPKSWDGKIDTVWRFKFAKDADVAVFNPWMFDEVYDKGGGLVS